MSKTSDVVIQYAQSDDDVIAIHAFLCVVAAPYLPGPIDAKQSIQEVWRVVNDDVALMAIKDDKLIGTIGLIRPTYWWNGKLPFLANRWFFTLTGWTAGRPLLKEARAIARSSELELHIISEERCKISIFNKNKVRGKTHVLRRHADVQSRDQGASVLAH